MSSQHASRARTPVARPQPHPNRYVCVHGHFYQPPRENPWLETVEVQDSATPFHDWNERITAECYATNGASRIQDKQNRIVRILNNYSRMSFNFGPTLLSWLNDFAHRTYRMIQDADKASAQRYSGHGSALAQVYNHIIMPLASDRDARTQIRWGIADFESRFGRKPEGMWLAETAVSRRILDIMAQEGIKFTVLAPHQCAHVRKLAAKSPGENTAAAPLLNDEAGWDEEAWAKTGPVVSAASESSPPGPTTLSATSATGHETAQETNSFTSGQSGVPASTQAVTPIEEPWTETPNATVDTTHPYVVPLDEGRSIAVFFYDGPSSRAIAFEGLLNSGENFGRRLIASLPAAPAEPQLAHVATDGESYGHHHRHGEMALSYAMHWIEEQGLAIPTNYGEFLALFPPSWEAEVVDDSSWSCSHGVERWRSNCGCNGGKPGWNQEWRGPLRESLDFLRDSTARLAEQAADGLLEDLWAARDAYIQVVLDRSAREKFLAAHQTRELLEEERVRVFELMEMERHTQLMYTSCGWFFDEISGIETVQIIAYAGRVLQLAAKLFGEAGAALEPRFLEILGRAQSNVPGLGSGADVYRKYVTGMSVDLEHVGAHYAISSMFQTNPDIGEIFCYTVERQSYELLTSGRGRVALGRASLRSRITEEREEVCFAVLHLGDQNLSAAVRRYHPDDEEAWNGFLEAARTDVRRANLPELVREIDRYFGGTLYSLTSLFADEQRRILKSILDTTLNDVESSLVRIYEEHATLLDFLGETDVAAPPALALTASFAINASLRKALEAEVYDTAEVARLLRRADIDHISLDTGLLSYTADRRMRKAMKRLEEVVEQGNIATLQDTLAIAESLRTLPFEVNLWQSQNIWNDLLQRGKSKRPSREWRDGFRKLGLALNIAVDNLVVEEGVPAF